MATATGAGDRLSAAKAHAAKSAAARLAPKLEKANTKAYLAAMQGHAKSFGQKPPKAITDKDVLAAIAARAQVSATSIVNTQADRMAALVAQHGSLAAAQAPFKAWEKGQLALITSYESGMSVNAAVSDFQERNSELTGLEHVEPRDGVCDECNAAIDMGDVPLGELPDMPLHINCVHSNVAVYEMPDDPASLWFGG